MNRSFVSASILTATLAVSPVWASGEPLPTVAIPNFHRVNDRLYRGGQPTDQGWETLAKLGIKTVIDLRRDEEHSTAAESTAVCAAGMRYVNIPIRGLNTPTDDQLARFLGEVDDDEPVFLHCRQGRDRTGTLVAVYRMEREGWDNPKALSEAESCGIHWYSRSMKSFIRAYEPAATESTAIR